MKISRSSPPISAGQNIPRVTIAATSTAVPPHVITREEVKLIYLSWPQWPPGGKPRFVPGLF